MIGGRWIYNFQYYFNKVAADQHTLLGQLKPLLEGCAIVFSGDGHDDPFPGVLDTLLAQGDDCQGFLTLLNRKKLAGARSGK
jgi:hypothetical protein